MDYDDGIEAKPSQNRAARKGRRASTKLTESSKNNTRDEDDSSKPAKRRDGWGNESANADHEMEDERLYAKTIGEENADEVPDIPVLPDTEEIADIPAPIDVARAPTVHVNRVATYKELDSDLMKHTALQTLDDDINLKLLTIHISAEVDIHEDDEEWEWDRLFTEVSSELNTEWNINEENVHDE